MKAKHLVVLRGPMAVGKSTLARALGRHFGWPVVDKDDASDILLAVMDDYSALSYTLMFSQARSLLDQGFSVIVDSPLRGELGLVNAKVLSQDCKVHLAVLDCVCSDEHLWQQRLENREQRPAHQLRSWADFERYWQDVKQDFVYPVDSPILQLDTVHSLEVNIDRVSRWLDSVAFQKDAR